MRRILENYFRILGGVDRDQLLADFEGDDKVACQSLLSWVRDGSHVVPDDVFFTVDQGQIEMFRSVFRKIFEKRGQIEHYKMMMKVDEM